MQMNAPRSDRPPADLADDMSLLDLWSLIRNGWYLLVIGMAISLMLASVYLAMEPKIYEATLQIELGKIQRPGNVDWIESHADVSQRVVQPDFQSRVLSTLGWRSNVLGDFLRSSIHAYRDDSNVEIKVRSNSVEDARKAGEAIGDELVSVHHMLAQRFVASDAEDRAALSGQISTLEAIVAELDEIGRNIPQDGFGGGDWQLGEVVQELPRPVRDYPVVPARNHDA